MEYSPLLPSGHTLSNVIISELEQDSCKPLLWQNNIDNIAKIINILRKCVSGNNFSYVYISTIITYFVIFIHMITISLSNIDIGDIS